MSEKKEKQKKVPFDVDSHLEPGRVYDDEEATKAFQAMRGLCSGDFMAEYFQDDTRKKEYSRSPYRPEEVK